MNAEELRKTRVELGLTQDALAAVLGVQRNTIARWERGDLVIGQPLVLFYALAYIREHRPHETDEGEPK